MEISKKISMERAMNMSLEQYIKESGIYISPMLYKSQQSPKNLHEDIDLDAEHIKEEELSICGDSYSTSNLRDLRDKLLLQNSSTIIDTTPKLNSQQWRLIHPNNAQNRPAGMPPLVNNDGIETIFTINHNKIKNVSKSRKRKRGRQNKHQQQQGNNNMQKQPGRNDNQQQTQNQIQRQNQLRNQPQNASYRQNLFKAFNGRVERNNIKNRWTVGPKQNNPQNQNNRQTNNCNVGYSRGTDLQVHTYLSNEPAGSIQNSISDPIQAIDLTSRNHQKPIINTLQTLNPSNVFDAFGGIKLELMPFIAGKLLDAIKGPQSTPGPKYDMKLQREIHDIQGKSMVYKCPGGEVISSDGPGLNCKMTPASTGVSLNQRFA